MKIIDHLSQGGHAYFRQRSYLPLLLLPLLAAGAVEAGRAPHPLLLSAAWQVGSLAVSLAGLALRIWVVGTAPRGTSERSTSSPRAAQLNTSGAYSLVRHPLYLGNTLVALGPALLTGFWPMPMLFVFASLLYHERIAGAEEAFLEREFGAAFCRWAEEVPAWIPRFAGYRSPVESFSLARAASELHALVVVASSLLLVRAVQGWAVAGRPSVGPAWTRFGVVCWLAFLVYVAVKKSRKAWRSGRPSS